MIKYIKTDRFKKLGTTTFTFTEGTNVIVGENGAGKSTIFSAIRFALFGLSAISASKQNVPTYGESGCKVTLAINDFIVVRTLNDCKIYYSEDGNVAIDNKYKVAEGPKPCTNWIMDKLNLDHKMFSIFNMSMQGETGALITLGATELNRVVENYAGVSIIDKVIKSVNEEVGQLKSKLAYVTLSDTKEMKEALLLAEKDKKFSNKVLLTLTEKSKGLKESLKLAEAKYDKAVENNNKAEKYQQLISAKESELAALNKEKEILQKELVLIQGELVGVDGNLESLAEELREELNDYYQKDRQHSKLENKLETLLASISKYKKESELEEKYAERKLEIEREIEEYKDFLLTVEANNTAIINEINGYKKELKSGVCQSCNRPFENFDASALKEKINKAEALLAKGVSDRDEKSLSLSRLKKELSSIPRFVEGGKELAQELSLEANNIRNEIVLIEQEYENFDEEYKRSELAKTEATINNKDKLNNKLKSITGRMQEVVSAITKVKEAIKEATPYLKVDQETYYAEIIDLNKSINLVSKEFMEEKEKLSEIENKIKSLNKEISIAEENNKVYRETSTKLSTSTELAKYLKSSRVKFMSTVWTTILSVASDFVNTTTVGWITEVGRSDKGEFTFTDNGIVSPVVSEASGAQKEFIGTAVRVGLAVCLAGNNAMMLLDEPTAGMTEENANKLASGLLGISGQKILITHRVSEKLTAENIISLT